MKLDAELERSIKGLRLKINTFFVFAIVFAVAALGVYAGFLFFPTEVDDFFSGDGTDIVNGITVLFASLSGVLFVYIAFLGQQWQLIYQQQEIRDNRTEMKASTAELKIQAKALTEQINKMDRDFVHQNFFRILEQHFKTRDRVEFSGRTGEEAFIFFFKRLVRWVNDKGGWDRDIDDQFLMKNGYEWYPKRPELGLIGDIDNTKLKPTQDPKHDLNKFEVGFILRAILSEYGLGKYLRSCYFLLEYIKENDQEHDLSNYLNAVEAGMDQNERVFLLYQLINQFDVDGYKELKDWLIEKRFLASVQPKHLLDPRHMEWIYPTERNPEYKK
jgi:hypothetical protein